MRPKPAAGVTACGSLYIDLCNCLILICSIQHQMKVNLWTKNSYRLWLTN
ncbi:IS91 family transposase, partial [Escherichia coli]|nr:IS91 family transposase [Escherichia coli]